MVTLSKMIDHTLLKSNASEEEIIELCKEAMEYEFKSVCVNPFYVSKCREILKGSGVKITTVIGFPLGNNRQEVKVLESQLALEDGADEIDMVINIAALKNKDYDYVREEIASVVNSVGEENIVKVIIETCYLTQQEKIKACELSRQAGADFIKTSTGFASQGATVDDIRLIKKVVGNEMGIKASGGIRNYEIAKSMVDAGATRLGASSGIQIIKHI